MLSGESKNHASNTNNTNRTQPQPENLPANEAGVHQTLSHQARGKARACRRQEDGRHARANAVQAVQARLGGDCGPYSERARHSLCVPVLSKVASRSRSGTRIQEDATRPMGPFAPRRRVEEESGSYGTFTQERAVCR